MTLGKPKALRRLSAPARPAANSKSQIDKLGERMKRGERSSTMLYEIASFRDRFIPITEAVAQRIMTPAPRFIVDITQRPAKSTPSIIGKLQREHRDFLRFKT